MSTKTYSGEWDGGLACDFPRKTNEETIIAGVVVSKYQVLGRDSNGKWKPSLTTAVDESEDIKAIAACDIDTTVEGTSADTQAPIFLTGSFIEEEVEFNDHTLDTALKDSLRALQIYVNKYGGAS